MMVECAQRSVFIMDVGQSHALRRSASVTFIFIGNGIISRLFSNILCNSRSTLTSVLSSEGCKVIMGLISLHIEERASMRSGYEHVTRNGHLMLL